MLGVQQNTALTATRSALTRVVQDHEVMQRLKEQQAERHRRLHSIEVGVLLVLLVL